MKFQKPSKTPKEHIELLKSRGLAISDEPLAEHYLKFIGYYRLGGYFIPFQFPNDPSHRFLPGSTFDRIIEVYSFDRELRLLMMDAVERVEVAFRACLSNHMCSRYGPHWFMNQRVFRNSNGFFPKLMKIVREKSGCELEGFPTSRRSPEPFLAQYFAKYDDPKLPPSWMITEVLSFSDWSWVYEEIDKREDRKPISDNFKLAPEVLQSWMHALAYSRNICAHHGRLWNRDFTIKPLIAKTWAGHLTPNHRFYAQAFVLNQLMLVVSPQTTWSRRLFELLAKYSRIDPVHMGFPKEWATAPEWGLRR
jgi:abortive infection bacteriophage resistance protein